MEEINAPSTVKSAAPCDQDSPSACRILGVRVDLVQIPDVIDRINTWIRTRSHGHYITVTNLHGVVEAVQRSSFYEVLESSSLCVADGMSLVWAARLRGAHLERRVYGPELMLEFCAHDRGREVRHFLYGGKEGVAEQLASRLKELLPGIQIVGTHCPPFRELTKTEDEEVRQQIAACKPDIIWVGIGCPKQEQWMFDHRGLAVPAMVGVGAAFDFHTGNVTQAPVWMRENGLEWLYRLIQEPRRLWRRYLVYGSKFVFWSVLEMAGLQRFRPQDRE